MPELKFQVESAEPLTFAATPHVQFKLRIVDREATTAIHSVALRCQIRIEPTKRRYVPEEQQRLFELFGRPGDWSRTVHSMLWTHASLVIPQFRGETAVDLPVACTYDFNVAATKYFASLQEGDLPLCFLFSGTVFHQAEGGGLQIAQISWQEEAAFRLPVSVWRGMMDIYYPNTVWVAIQRAVYEQVDDYKRRHALTSWEEALEKSLEESAGHEGGTNHRVTEIPAQSWAATKTDLC